MAIRWTNTSESVVDWNRQPRRTSARRSTCALVRLPLCATAKPPNSKSAYSGWTLRRIVSPVVA